MLALRALMLAACIHQSVSQQLMTTATQPLTEDTIALVVLANKGVPTTDGSFCSDADAETVSNTLTESIGNTPGRDLRDEQNGRMLPSCLTLCAGFPRGQCYLVYSWCSNRRDLEVEEEKELEKVATTPNLRGLDRRLASSITTDWKQWEVSHPTEYQLCLDRKALVESALLNIIKSDLVAPKCHNMLLNRFTIGCVDVSTLNLV